MTLAAPKGIADVELIGSAGQVVTPNATEWDFLYSVSSVKDPAHNIGDRVVTPDGRTFRYAKAAGTCSTGFGAKCTSVFAGLTLQASPAIGDNFVTVLNVSALGTLTANQLRGAPFVIHTDAGDKTHNGFLLGNDAAAVGASMRLFLDRKIVQRTFLSTGAAAGYMEVMPNPYSQISGYPTDSDTFASVLGVPAAYATSGQYFWLQTWGPCWITPGGGSPSGVGITANGREVVFVGDGSINATKDITLNNGYQRAGFIIQKDPSTPAGGGPPFIMLQISP